MTATLIVSLTGASVAMAGPTPPDASGSAARGTGAADVRADYFTKALRPRTTGSWSEDRYGPGSWKSVEW